MISNHRRLYLQQVRLCLMLLLHTLPATHMPQLAKQSQEPALLSSSRACRGLMSAPAALCRASVCMQEAGLPCWSSACTTPSAAPAPMQGRCLWAWLAQAQRQRWRRRQLQRGLAAREAWLQRRALAAMLCQAARRADRRRQLLRAAYYRSFTLLSAALQQWGCAAGMLRAEREQDRQALALWAARQYWAVLAAWRQGLLVQRFRRYHKQVRERSLGYDMCLYSQLVTCAESLTHYPSWGHASVAPSSHLDTCMVSSHAAWGTCCRWLGSTGGKRLEA